MATTVRSVEQRLLKKGTTTGPVTQKMIDRSKEMYFQASELAGDKKDKWGWLDFIPLARKEQDISN
jgi:hypothetical protein